VAGEITFVASHHAFPMVVAGEPQVVVDISFDARAVSTGAIRRGDETLATISGDVSAEVTRTGACGE
jgi:hypothetical protein